jgi:fumarate hydratase class II
LAEITIVAEDGGVVTVGPERVTLEPGQSVGVERTELDEDKVSDYVGRSLMLVTALSPHIGYDKASAIAHKADDEGSTLREAALALGVAANDFDRIVDPESMVGDPRQDLGLTS